MKYYFIGIGGIGMSGLAKILIQEGNEVSGSDKNKNAETEKLEQLGVKVNHDHVAENISGEIDMVVITAAITPNNPELVRAHELGLTIVKRPQLLNTIITKKKSIAVVGTHGKTTVSSMLATIFIEDGLDPTAIIGARVEAMDSNSRNGNGEYSIAEVCEYQRAFLEVHPYAAIITNIEADHLDCYKDIDDIKSAFKIFVSQIDPNGFLVYCGDDNNATEIAQQYPGKKISYGLTANNDIVGIKVKTNGESSFEVSSIGKFTLRVPGKHNILNALATIATSKEIGINIESTIKSLANFKGAERRFQFKGFFNNAPIIDDYAHHPTEIAATISAARDKYPDKRLVIVFQPHQHSRTLLLKNDFVAALTLADTVIMPEIYAVRDNDADIAAISSRDIVSIINSNSPQKAFFYPDFESTEVALRKLISKNDVVITIGAGPVNKIGESLLKN